VQVVYGIITLMMIGLMYRLD